MTTSIVIPVFNALQYLKMCVDSIRNHTSDYELIIVDNGSKPECVEYIKSIGCKTVLNHKNLGPGAAFNQGIRISDGEYVCLLNSDVKVTAGWLTPLVATLQSDPQIGIVGPLCDNISSIQTNMALKRDNINVCMMKGYVMPFVCVAMRRSIFMRRGVGLMAERFVSGCSEDSEFCIRLDRAGYLKAIAVGSFVNHALSQTYKDNGIDCMKSVEEMGKLLDAEEEIKYLDD